MNESPAPIHADVGDNRPPLKDQLTIRHQDLIDRVSELVAACGRAPETIGDDTTQGKVGDLYKMLSAAQKKGEASRTDEKEPFLMGGREVDNFFRERVLTPLERWMAVLKKRSDLYLNAKIAAERAAREAEARRAQEEANQKLEAARRAEEANRKKAAETKLAAAVVAQEAADQAAAAAEAKPAELAQTRGDHSLATVQMIWTHEVEDWNALDLNSIRDFISRDDIDKAIRAFVRLHKGSRQLVGVRIFEAPRSSFR